MKVLNKHLKYKLTPSTKPTHKDYNENKSQGSDLDSRHLEAAPYTISTLKTLNISTETWKDQPSSIDRVIDFHQALLTISPAMRQ